MTTPDELANKYNEYFMRSILDELGDETLERVDWVTVEQVNLAVGACRVSFLGHDAGWVKFGKAIPNVGERVPMHSTFHGDKWIKLLTRPWEKIWDRSPAPIEATAGYPYHEFGGAGLDAWAGREYCTEFGYGFSVVADGSDSELGLPLNRDDMHAPELHPRIDVMVQMSDGEILWIFGEESEDPQMPELPDNCLELGRVISNVAASGWSDEVDNNVNYLFTDRRRDPDEPKRFFARSFNQAGARFTDIMQTPSLSDVLSLQAPSIFGDGRDGAGIAHSPTSGLFRLYNLANESLCGRSTGDCAYVELSNWGYVGANRLFAPPPPGVVAGDIVMAYIARAKEGGEIGRVGYTYIGKVILNDGAGLIMERTSPPEADINANNYYAYVMRVPQYSTLEMQTNSRCYTTPIYGGGPGALAIKTFDIQGAGRFDMSGSGCLGGDPGYQCGPPEGRTREGQGLKDKPLVDQENGIGMYGGGYGAQVEWCDPYNYNQGAGGAGGGAGQGGWDPSWTGYATGNGENGAFPNGLVTYTATGDPGPRGADTDTVSNLTSTPNYSAGYMRVGCGGGAGFASDQNGGDHGGTDGGGDGGGCIAMFCKQGSPLLDAGGARHAINWTPLFPTDSHVDPVLFGAGGGGGGCIYIASVLAQNPVADVSGQGGGIRYHAIHDDGWGGNGARGLIVLQRGSLLSGSFTPGVTIIDLPELIFNGTWISEPFDTGRPGYPKTLRSDWVLDGSDNIPPKFYIEGSNNAQFTEANVFYPPDGYFQAGDPDYPISDNLELDLTGIVLEPRRYWRVFAELDTGGVINMGDTPYIGFIDLTGVS